MPVTLQHMIAAGAAIVAVLAGIAVTTIEYPLHMRTPDAPGSELPATIPEPVADAAVLPAPIAVDGAHETGFAAEAKPAAETLAPAVVAESTAPSAAVHKEARKIRKTPHAAGPATAQAAGAGMEKRTIDDRDNRAAVSAAAAAVSPKKAAAVTMKPRSIDDQYDAVVKKECGCSTFAIICRESVRWRLCNGRWNDGNRPYETRCFVARTQGGFLSD